MLRMFQLLISSRYRRVRKMQLHLVLFALFIHTIFSHLYPRPPPTGIPWNSRVKVLDNYFLIVPALPGKCGGYNIGTLTLLGFSVV